MVSSSPLRVGPADVGPAALRALPGGGPGAGGRSEVPGLRRGVPRVCSWWWKPCLLSDKNETSAGEEYSKLLGKLGCEEAAALGCDEP